MILKKIVNLHEWCNGKTIQIVENTMQGFKFHFTDGTTLLLEPDHQNPQHDCFYYLTIVPSVVQVT